MGLGDFEGPRAERFSHLLKIVHAMGPVVALVVAPVMAIAMWLWGPGIWIIPMGAPETPPIKLSQRSRTPEPTAPKPTPSGKKSTTRDGLRYRPHFDIRHPNSGAGPSNWTVTIFAADKQVTQTSTLVRAYLCPTHDRFQCPPPWQGPSYPGSKASPKLNGPAQVGPRMKAELTADSPDVTATIFGSQVEVVSKELGYVQWYWTVKSAKKGRYLLVLTLTPLADRADTPVGPSKKFPLVIEVQEKPVGTGQQINEVGQSVKSGVTWAVGLIGSIGGAGAIAALYGIQRRSNGRQGPDADQEMPEPESTAVGDKAGS